MDRSQQSSSNLMDTHNRLVADILTRYRTLMMLATVQAEGDKHNATPESMAVTGISMKMEFEGLYSSVKEMLTLSRRIKELWIFGSLGKDDPGQREKEERIEQDVRRVGEMLNGLEEAKMRALAEGAGGGKWEALREEAAGL